MLKSGELKHYGVLGMKWGVRKKYESAKETIGDAASKVATKASTTVKSATDSVKSLLPKKDNPSTSSPKSYPKMEDLTGLNKNQTRSYVDKARSENARSNEHKGITKELTEQYGDRYRKIPATYKFNLENFYSRIPQGKKQEFDEIFNAVEDFIKVNAIVTSFDELDRLPPDMSGMLAANADDINDLQYDPTKTELIDLLMDDNLSEEDKIRIWSYSNNCTNTSATYELRRRGYDVEAMPYALYVTMNSTYETENALGYKDGYAANFKSGFEWSTPQFNWKEPDKEHADVLKSAILDSNKGDHRGYVTTTGHIFNYEVQDNKVNFIDGQTVGLNNPRTIEVINNSYRDDLKFARTDNLELDISILSRVRKHDD